MRNNHTLLLVTVLLFIISGLCSGGDIDFSIRYYNQEIYYPDSPVQLKVSIRNNSSEVYRFRLAESRSYNFDFTVSTLSNLERPHSTEYLQNRYINQPLYYRDMALNTGEEFSLILNLGDYIDLSEPGTYIIRSSFFPELTENPLTYSSNAISLIVKPSIPGVSRMEDLIEAEINEIITAQPLPPDEIIEYIITARQKSQWNKFFLYLDLESLYLMDENMERRYNALPEQDRILVLKEFREKIISGTTDFTSSIFLGIPQSFEIIQTTYTQNQAVVTVDERFDFVDYREIKRYTYYLERRSDIWMVYNYDVLNIGTE